MGLESYQKGLNKFHDLSHEEFILTHTGLRKPKHVYYKVLAADTTTRRLLSTSTKPTTAIISLPAAIDYRNISGFVQPIKDQGFSCIKH